MFSSCNHCDSGLSSKDTVLHHVSPLAPGWNWNKLTYHSISTGLWCTFGKQVYIGINILCAPLSFHSVKEERLPEWEKNKLQCNESV
jgi:hypothetical protein